MFYSEALLSKTGPLARVWLSANLERKLSKTHILQSNVKDSVDAIVNPGQAPMALRLSGQLLLGVVRIYSRKARYLLDDCNEALMKIKMAFRLSSNNDMPTSLHGPSRDALLLPDVLTEGDNLELPPLPDISLLMSQMEDDSAHLARRRRAGSEINLNEDFPNSQFLQSSVLETRKEPEEEFGFDNDDLDLGIDFDDIVNVRGERSIEMGRDAPTPRAFGDDIGDSIMASKDGNLMDVDRQHSVHVSIADDDGFQFHGDDDGDINMGGLDDFGIGDGPDTTLGAAALPPRISESPLSDVDPQILEAAQNMDTTLFEPSEEPEETIIRQPAQRVRKLKQLRADAETIIPSATIKAQQQDRSKILRPESTLPRDPLLFGLLEMQRRGEFVSNIMNDGRSSEWAPELRGMLSLEAIMKSRSQKRKRDSAIADMDSDEEDHARKSPRLALDIDDEDDGVFTSAGVLDGSVAPDGTIVEFPNDESSRLVVEDDENFGANESRDHSAMPEYNFDETTAPLVHPADSGPVSLGTQHAVHLLRDKFGPEAENSPDKRKKASVLFQDLLPERTTSKADATKMFFEILVLATKDAVKVEQQEGSLGGPIRVRGKRGLWGNWAEREAGGEISEETGTQPPVAVVS